MLSYLKISRRIQDKIIFFVKRLLAKQASKVNHKELIKDVYEEIDISPGYFATLTLANLIALNGLIQNSAAVIIGAMLISPLMGPILSFGFAFITGDHLIWKKSVKKIALSIVISYTGSPVNSTRKQRLAKKRIEEVVAILEHDYRIPLENTRTSLRKSRKIEAPAVKIVVKTSEAKG